PLYRAFHGCGAVGRPRRPWLAVPGHIPGAGAGPGTALPGDRFYSGAVGATPEAGRLDGNPQAVFRLSPVRHRRLAGMGADAPAGRRRAGGAAGRPVAAGPGTVAGRAPAPQPAALAAARGLADCAVGSVAAVADSPALARRRAGAITVCRRQSALLAVRAGTAAARWAHRVRQYHRGLVHNLQGQRAPGVRHPGISRCAAAKRGRVRQGRLDQYRWGNHPFPRDPRGGGRSPVRSVPPGGGGQGTAHRALLGTDKRRTGGREFMKPTTPLYPGLLLALLVMVLYAIDVAKTHAGEPVADLRWPDLDGRTRALEEWQGRHVLLNYWASWCGPCIKEMPDLDAFASAQAEDGVQVIGIALDEAETVRAFLQRVPVGYPVLIEAVPGGESG